MARAILVLSFFIFSTFSLAACGENVDVVVEDTTSPTDKNTGNTGTGTTTTCEVYTQTGKTGNREVYFCSSVKDVSLYTFVFGCQGKGCTLALPKTLIPTQKGNMTCIGAVYEASNLFPKTSSEKVAGNVFDIAAPMLEKSSGGEAWENLDPCTGTMTDVKSPDGKAMSKWITLR